MFLHLVSFRRIHFLFSSVSDRLKGERIEIPEVLMGVKTGTAPARPVVITPTHADAWVFLPEIWPGLVMICVSFLRRIRQ